MVVGALSAGQAQAVIVNVNGQNWNVTTFTGTFNNNISKFNTAANGGVMPWSTSSAGSNSTALSFVNAVGASLGFPNFDGTGGPLFAYFKSPTSPNPFLSYGESDFMGGIGEISCTNCNPVGSNQIATWAQADLVPPVPGPLPALGAAAAFGFSRKLRQRIRAGTKFVSSSSSL